MNINKFQAARTTAVASTMALTLIGTLLGVTPAVAVGSGTAAGSDGHVASVNDTDRLALIGEKYDVGDRLSPSDAAFVKAHAMPAEGAIATRGTSANCFRKSGASGAGVVDGCHGSVVGSSLTIRWQTGYTATGNSSVTKIKAAERIRAYGLVGSGGVGLVYSANPSATVNGRTNKFSRSGSFTALAAYVTVQYDATFYTRTGSFNVSGG